MKAIRDGDTVILHGSFWAVSFPVEQLPGWLAFYRDQREKFPKSGGNYDATIAALEELGSDAPQQAQEGT